MSDVKRYDCYGKDALGYDYPALSREAIDGDWVLAEDHIAECDALRARLADIQGILDEAQKIVTACLDDKARLAEAERLFKLTLRCLTDDEDGDVCHGRIRQFLRTTDADSAADSAAVVRKLKSCPRCYGKSPLCHRCQGTGMIDAPTSADDPSCPECDGEGHE